MSDSNNTNKDEDNWGYFPSAAAAIVFLVVYSILLLAHLSQAIRYRTIWVWPLIVGVALEVVGYATRWVSTNDLSKIWPIAVSQTTVIVAPAFIAAQNYMMVGRIMSFLGSDYSPLSHHLITKIFVISDFISILSQAIGGSMLSADTLNTIRVGFYILVGALGFQVFIFLVFVVITIVFDRRSRAGLGEKRNVVQPVFTAFYVSATMIILRSIFRLIEFATVKFTPDAAEGYTLHHEWLLYVWDALPITVCVITLAVAHAGKYLPRTKGLRIDGTYEEPSPSRVCGCCCVYKRPRKFDVEAFQRSQQTQVQMAQADPSRSTFHSRVALMPPTKQ